MKTPVFAFIFFSFIILSCGSNKLTNHKDLDNNFKTSCPNDGTCYFEFQRNKVLEYSYDDLGNINPEIKPGNNLIITFEYKRNEIPNTADGHYNEIVYLELNPDDIPLKLENKYLQNVKLTFGRFCYCKGQSGYYKITNGSLFIKKLTAKDYTLKLTFITDDVPQIITKINEAFSL